MQIGELDHPVAVEFRREIADPDLDFLHRRNADCLGNGKGRQRHGDDADAVAQFRCDRDAPAFQGRDHRCTDVDCELADGSQQYEA
ncbi:hypothetical protein D3C87_1812090 [compost metagenome]